MSVRLALVTAAVALSVVLALMTLELHQEAPSENVTATELTKQSFDEPEVPPTSSHEDQGDREGRPAEAVSLASSEEDDGAQVPAPATAVPTSKPNPVQTTQPKSSYLFPLAPEEPGKLVIIAFDQASQQPSSQLARALRSALLNNSGPTQIQIPTVTARQAQDLASGTYPPPPPVGQTPWGAQYLLVASGSFRELPQASPYYKSVSLNLSTQLVSASEQTVVAHSQQPHTGKDTSVDAALAQAADACLKPLLGWLV